jgi:HSP20 family protein
MLERWSPFAEMERMWNELDRVFNEAFGRTRPSLARPWTYRPATDIYDTGDALVVKVAVPGANPEDIEVSIEQNALTIRGRYGYQLSEDEAKKAAWYRREIGMGEFAETFTLPAPVDADHAQASFADGILTLTLPKAEQARIKRIPVQAHKALAGSLN